MSRAAVVAVVVVALAAALSACGSSVAPPDLGPPVLGPLDCAQTIAGHCGDGGCPASVQLATAGCDFDLGTGPQTVGIYGCSEARLTIVEMFAAAGASTSYVFEGPDSLVAVLGTSAGATTCLAGPTPIGLFDCTAETTLCSR